MAKYYLPAYILKAGIDQNSWKEVRSSDALEHSVYMGESRDEVYGGMVCLDEFQMFDVASEAPRWDCLEVGFYCTMGELSGVDYDDFDVLEDFLDEISSCFSAWQEEV